IVDELTKIFSTKIKEGNTFVDKTEKEKIIFDSYDLKLFEKEIGLNKLEKDFLIFSPNPIKLLSFMNELSFSSFIVPASNLDSIKIKLHLFLKDYIKYELLAREGYNRGLEKSQNVTEWVKIWYENFLLKKKKNEYFNNSNKLLNYSEIKDYIAEEKTNTIEGEEIFNKFISSTIELSDKFKYKINEKLFSQIEQGNINLFVVHNLGFGGSIPAVPSSPPFIEWQIEKEKRISKNSN
ncbi:MAG: hypothetical protein KDC90_06100, partial [Ignavibacteriae bacterium]|nr:hypothetical protein [Ignavibacteriota bacterium]